MKYGFITVASAVPNVSVADVDYNVHEMTTLISQAEEQGVEILCFPELGITGYSCQDMFNDDLLQKKTNESVSCLLDFTKELNIIIILGLPVPVNGMLLNCAMVIQGGDILGVVPKVNLPNYGEFYEKRWFASASDLRLETIVIAGRQIMLTSGPTIFTTSSGAKFGIEICEDLWAPIPPSCCLALGGADIIFNLSASDELIGKHDYLKSLLSTQSARLISGYVYSSCGYGESTQDVVYGGNALIYENGQLLCESERFSLDSQLMITQIDIEKLRHERRANSTFMERERTDSIRTVNCKPITEKEFRLIRPVNPNPFIPQCDKISSACEEILNIQTMGLVKRLSHTNSKKAVIGISGGLDSTLALLVCVRAFDRLKLDRKGIVGVTMPGFGTTDRTHDNAVSLMCSLGITVKEINISESVLLHFKDIGHDVNVHDVTYENSQARERTQILMDLSNEVGGLVIGTGDLSELALGWATYNGDHMSMYGVNSGVPKTLIRYLVGYIADNEMDVKSKATLWDIIDTPISPELIPAEKNGEIKQKTEALVGPYELHDFFLYHFLRFGFSPAKIYMLALNAFNSSLTATIKYDDDTIKHWLKTFFRRFFSQQFKRSCMPDGPKVGSVSLSPRGDWRMSSDISGILWIQECDKL